MKSSRDASAKRGAIYRPSSAGWQKWTEDAAGASTLQGEGLELSDLQPAAGGLIAVPVRRAFSLCVWVPADDPSVFRDLVLTQLEMRGLADRAREETSFAWQEITRADNEVLFQVTVLPPHLAPRYWHGEVTDYAVSAACLPLDPDAVSIWREQGTWVAAVTRGGKLLHFQSLAEPVPGGPMALEVWMMISPLQAGNMVGDDLPVVFYRQAGDELDLGGWNEVGHPTERDFPPPVRPSPPLDCVPIAVRHLQVEKKKSTQRQRFAFTAAAVYLALVLVLAGQTLWLHWRARGLRAEIDGVAPAVTATKEAMDKWQALQPALEPSTYPLEILYQTSRLLPKDGVRFTLFEMNLDRVLIQGEASTLAAAIKFQDDLEKNADLEALYDWTAETPKQLPNGSTRFQIDGTRRGSAAQTTNESADI